MAISVEHEAMAATVLSCGSSVDIKGPPAEKTYMREHRMLSPLPLRAMDLPICSSALIATEFTASTNTRMIVKLCSTVKTRLTILHLICQCNVLLSRSYIPAGKPHGLSFQPCH